DAVARTARRSDGGGPEGAAAGADRPRAAPGRRQNRPAGRKLARSRFRPGVTLGSWPSWCACFSPGRADPSSSARQPLMPEGLFRPRGQPGEAMDEERPPFRYDAGLAGQIERRWQERWEREGTFQAANPSGALSAGFGVEAGRPKFYLLDFFPYP